MDDFRSLLKNLFIFSLMIAFVYGMYWCYQLATDGFTKSYCGRVEKKLVEQYFHKSTARTDYIMIINFDVIGRQEIDVSRSTYFNKDEGDDICFTFNTHRYENRVTHSLKAMWGMICGFVAGMGLLALIAAGVWWLFTGKWLYGEEN